MTRLVAVWVKRHAASEESQEWFTLFLLGLLLLVLLIG